MRETRVVVHTGMTGPGLALCFQVEHTKSSKRQTLDHRPQRPLFCHGLCTLSDSTPTGRVGSLSRPPRITILAGDSTRRFSPTALHIVSEPFQSQYEWFHVLSNGTNAGTALHLVCS